MESFNEIINCEKKKDYFLGNFFQLKDSKIVRNRVVMLKENLGSMFVRNMLVLLNENFRNFVCEHSGRRSFNVAFIIYQIHMNNL